MRHVAGPLLVALAAATALAGCNNTVPIDRNEAPFAVMGDDLAQPANLPVFLDGRASYDPDGDDLIFHWTVDHAPAESALMDLTDPFSPNHSTDAATTRFQPDATGTYVIELRTQEQRGEEQGLYSDPTYLIVEALEPDDRPIANAGRDQFLTLGETAYLDGGQSIDPLGGVLEFSWTLVDKPYNSTLDVDSVVNRESQQAELTADVPGDFTISLVVDNGQALSEPDTTELFFDGGNQQPVADAGGDFTAQDCMDVPLDCSASSDPDNDRLYYWWTIQGVPHGSAVDNRAISNQNAAKPEIYFDVAGEYQLACSVFDGQAWSRPDVVTLQIDERDFNTPPLVDAGPDRVADLGTVECTQTTSPRWPYPTITECDKCEGETMELKATVSDDDNDPYTLEWRVIKQSKLRLLGDVTSTAVNVEVPTISPDEIRTITELGYVELVATDCTLEEGRDDVEIETVCEAVLK